MGTKPPHPECTVSGQQCAGTEDIVKALGGQRVLIGMAMHVGPLPVVALASALVRRAEITALPLTTGWTEAACCDARGKNGLRDGVASMQLIENMALDRFGQFREGRRRSRRLPTGKRTGRKLKRCLLL
jgi:hypothetical protein